MAFVRGWVWLANWNPLIDQLGYMAGETLDEGLRKVLEDDLKETDTDASPPRWVSCRFDGPRPLAGLFGIEQGTDILFIQLDVPDELSAQAETILDLMKSYTLVARS
ncbi:hypothetical protein [Mesorhizobium sp. WSM3859]|uniref:hypothetical protein n=1 Tax=Mesorhizobium sp. WSM3859 TaxID=2029402 RepID=UPI000BB04381|nr:hypothetical protein [Mesorhizobium sp. WSM3859]PBC08518.1 hypothetical protein CK230_21635 [Mesorhizobium sp. WSM3859]